MLKSRLYLIIRLCAVPWGVFWIMYCLFGPNDVVRTIVAIILALACIPILPYYLAFVLVVALLLWIFPPIVVLLALLGALIYFGRMIVHLIIVFVANLSIDDYIKIIKALGWILFGVEALAALVCLSIWHSMFVIMLLTPVIAFAVYYYYVASSSIPEGELFEQLRKDNLAYQQAQTELARSVDASSLDRPPSIFQSLLKAERLRALNEQVKEENVFLEEIIKMIKNKARVIEEKHRSEKGEGST